jgi:DNA-directed RNA polymerase specialized sigma24 family protein
MKETISSNGRVYACSISFGEAPLLPFRYTTFAMASKHGVNTDKAADELYRRMFGTLYLHALSEGLSSFDAEDIVQHTFAFIFDHAINSYKEKISGGKQWIQQIFLSKMVDFFRKQSTRHRHENSVDESQEVSLDDPNIISFISQKDEWDPEQCVLTKEQDKEQREILIYVWDRLSEESKIEFREKNPGRGTGRKSYRNAEAEARTLSEKYYSDRDVGS